MEKNKEVVRKRFNKWPKEYDETFFGWVKGYQAVYKQASKLLDGKLHDKKVLDIGCGTGIFLTGLAETYPSSYFVGIDVSDNMILTANERNKKSKLENLEFKLGDSANLSFEDNSFDYVTSLISLHYWEHDKAIPEIKRVLKPDGKILIADNSKPISGKGATKIYDKEELKELFESHGFKNIKHHLSAPSRLWGLLPLAVGTGIVATKYAFKIPYIDYIGIPFIAGGIASITPLWLFQMITADVKK